MLSEKNQILNEIASADLKFLSGFTSVPKFLETVPNSKSKDEASVTKMSLKRFKCYKCNKYFPSFSELVMHLKLIHNACASNDCSKISDFKMHSSVCINRGFGCAICNKKFPEKYLLLTHFNEHIDAAFYACEICRDGFQEQKDLQQHLLDVHDKNVSLPVVPAHSKAVYQKCGHCSKYFKLFAEFEDHVSSCNSSTYACCICHVVFPTLSGLDQHKLTEHKLKHAIKGYLALKNGKRYFCGVCYLGFSKGDILKKHLTTHEMEMTYICDVCNVSFVNDCDLQEHYLQHIEEHYILHDVISQYSCNSCMKTFKTQKELKDHLLANCKNNVNNKNLPDFLSNNLQVKQSSCGSDGHVNFIFDKEIEGSNSNSLQEVLEPPSSTLIDTSDIPIYALKSGEDLLNCDDSECVVILDLASLFVLQRGVCASESRMPDVQNSEAYNETDVIDASILQTYMFKILCAENENCLTDMESSSNALNIEPSCSEQNLAANPDAVETVTVTFESNNDSIKFSALENNSECLLVACENDSMNSDITNNANEIIVFDSSVVSVNNNEGPSTDNIITQKKLAPNINQHANNNEIVKEFLIECNEELSMNDLYICNICKQVFGSKTSLCRHVKGSHTGFDCYRCGASFNSEDELKSHEKIIHQSAFQCDQCEVSYPKEHLLKKHKRGAHGGKQFVCNFCNKSYAMRHEYEIHMMCHKGKTPPTKCEICGKIYASISNYIRHKAIHEGKIPQKKFVCTVCEKAFIGSIPLKVHMRTHMKKASSRIECPKCKMYFSPKVIVTHIKSHDITP